MKKERAKLLIIYLYIFVFKAPELTVCKYSLLTCASFRSMHLKISFNLKISKISEKFNLRARLIENESNRYTYNLITSSKNQILNKNNRIFKLV